MRMSVSEYVEIGRALLVVIGVNWVPKGVGARGSGGGKHWRGEVGEAGKNGGGGRRSALGEWGVVGLGVARQAGSMLTWAASSALYVASSTDWAMIWKMIGAREQHTRRSGDRLLRPPLLLTGGC